MTRSVKGVIFALDETAMHDGPGIRMAIYFKGCPLRCIWCHSPESIYPQPEVVWYQMKCIRCGNCVKVCPEGLRSFEPIDHKDRRKCRLCRLCVVGCPKGALEIKGQVVSAGEIANHAIQLIPFFRRSGGGVTLSGGEPMFQVDFAYAILSLSRQANIHTALETSGYVSWENLEKIASVTDLFLFDFKHPDSELHQSYTGVSNRLILKNLARLIRLGAEIVVRVPLIPTYNDSPSTVKEIGHKVANLGARKISLLPFNPASAGKYSWLHRPFQLDNVKMQSDEYITKLEEMLRDEKLEVIPS